MALLGVGILTIAGVAVAQESDVLPSKLSGRWTAVGATQTFINPMSLEFEALRRLTAVAYGITMTLEPAMAALVGAVVLAQVLPPSAFIAIGAVMVAAAGVTLSDRRAVAPEPL